MGTVIFGLQVDGSEWIHLLPNGMDGACVRFIQVGRELSPAASGTEETPSFNAAAGARRHVPVSFHKERYERL